ncbi:MAG: hypothetical protein JRS35_06375 [Deltaproteobacteria bacterium]|nr:hypothetical protein [Deltaproteobacteria bacterium]
MRKHVLAILAVTMMLGITGLALASPADALYLVTEIIDGEGEGAGNTLYTAYAAAVDSSGNVCAEIERRTA